jgi:hypothetical protein
MVNNKPLTVSALTFEIPEGTRLSDVIRLLQDKDCEHFDDVLLKDTRIEFGSMSYKEYNERSPMKNTNFISLEEFYKRSSMK